MRHTTVTIVLVVLGVFLFSSSAIMQGGRQLSETGSGAADQTVAEKMNYVSDATHHKVIIGAEDRETYFALQSRNAIAHEIDYGSFKVVIVDELALGGRAELHSLTAPIRDEQNLIGLNGYVLDTLNPQPTYESLPADLRNFNLDFTAPQPARPRAGLYVVQFAGPIRDEWLDGLRQTGARIISYVPFNAYVVHAGDRTVSRLQRFQRRNLFVQFVGDYEPAFRLSPQLQVARRDAGDALVDVTVQVIDGPDADGTIESLRNAATTFLADSEVLNYRNVEITVPASSLTAIARLDGVFAVEERTVRKLLDEAQGQIVAGSLSGGLPTGPGYLSFLSSKGFTSSQFTSFAVNVVDDSQSLTGHPDLPSSRIAFQNNPSSQVGAQGGHGFLNSHIIGGFNNGTGAAVEDASGFNYGLGIAPFARVGVTAIFGPISASSSTWESTAYGQGARISSNSWGFINLFRYDTNAQLYDRIVRDAQTGTAGLQQMTVVFAAGNDGSAANTIGSPGTAKNVICVGAGENVRQTGTDGCGIANSGADNAQDVIGFSSRGPVNSAGGDGRVKPDIMAPGTHIEAGVPQSNYNGSSVCNQFFPAGQTLYGWSSGTSHSCPAVAGGAALVYQFFLNSGLAAPSPAMVKGYLMNTATRMTGVGANDTLPSNNQGMGRMDLGRAFDSVAKVALDQSVVLGASGQTHQVTGSVSDTSQPFRVTLAWTDAPGPTTGAPWINNLDLEVTANGQTFSGNVFSGGNSITGGVADTRNNVESVFLPAGTSGSFTITVRATNIAGDGVPGNADTTDQDFALIIYNGTQQVPTDPTIGVNPASLSFSATIGGANPANQSVSITNTGAGTLNWSASDDATWLSVSPASGTAPSTLTVSVNISGLSTGTFNGNITISAAGATNTPVTIPVTLTVSPVVTQLIVNGGFEGSISPWTLSGNASRSTGAFPHSGTGYLILAGVNNANGSARQQVSIPSGSSPGLSFFLNVTSNETTTTTQFDRLFIEVRSTTGSLLATLATFSNLNKGTAGAYVLRGPFGLSGFAGQTVRVQFRATTDFSLSSTFRIDDVSAQ